MTITSTLVMTGASRGVGRVAAERILQTTSEVHLVVIARDGSGAALAAELAAGGGRVSSISADLTSTAGTRRAGDEISARLHRGELPPLKGFIGNAGAQYTDALTTGPEGIEATFMVNVLANHIWIQSLMPHFAPGSRVTITISDTHFGDFRHNLGMVPGPRWQAPDTLARTVPAFARPTTAAAGRTAYSTSKLAAVYLVHELARRLPADVEVIAFNPGFVPGTALTRSAGPASQFLMRRVLPLMTATPIASSKDTAGRALADVALGRIIAPSGSYVDRRRVTRSSDESYDRSREAELWNALERLATA